MEIQTLTYSKNLKKLLQTLGEFYANELNLTKSKYKVFICTDKNLRKEGSSGLCAKTGDREITISLYSRLTPAEIMITLAHEMVHVKQFARGHYKSELKRGGKSAHHFWMGNKTVKSYMNRPWEIEAYKRQDELFTAALLKLTQNVKKSKKKA